MAMFAHNLHKPHVYMCIYQVYTQAQDSLIPGPLHRMAAVTHPPDDIINVPDHLTNHFYTYDLVCNTLTYVPIPSALYR